VTGGAHPTIRPLANDEIERVLRAEVVGRIGCHADGRTYVVPVSYIFEGGAVYAHSRDGLKVRMMRRNPEVCFGVDHVEDLVNWHSTICCASLTEMSGREERLYWGLLPIAEQVRRRGASAPATPG
jgi:nitroimidazol reductase NimA-like FMN-containing flavoprotein (pyridoxamine 5'-phosphate oxidase superfamily)